MGVVSLLQELHAGIQLVGSPPHSAQLDLLNKAIIPSLPPPGDFHRLEPDQQDTPTSEPAKGAGLLEEEFELPIDSTYLGVFMGQDGKHIKPLCREHGVQVHFKAAEETGSHLRRFGG